MAKITGKEKVRAFLELVPKATRKRLREAIRQSAESMADTMRNLAPHKTGRLRDSIKVTPGDEDLTLYEKTSPHRTFPDPELAMIIHTNLRYSRYVEFGTAAHINAGEFIGSENPGSRAKPFFFPGYRARKKDTHRRINNAAKTAIKDSQKRTHL